MSVAYHQSFEKRHIGTVRRFPMLEYNTEKDVIFAGVMGAFFPAEAIAASIGGALGYRLMEPLECFSTLG